MTGATSDRCDSSALDAIGDTPLVELSRMYDDVEGRVLAKLEMMNPTGSSWDRVARQVIEDAQREGRLAPHQTLVELCLGHTAVSFAMACALTRHPFVAVVERGGPATRVEALRAYGADMLFVDPDLGAHPGCMTPETFGRLMEAVERVVDERGAFHPNCFENVSNFRAHRLTTAVEFLIQTEGKLHMFCDFATTGGAFAGCAAAFKEHNAAIQCFLVEPEPTVVNIGIMGGEIGRSLPLLDRARVDGVVQVSEEDAILHARMLARVEGLFAGVAAGANLAAARQLLRGHHPGETIVVRLGEGGARYHATRLWRDEDVDAG
ncbi:MAG: pyridoxal-phosphate dependent enzyme [bacterium]|nr:pyridoxal-phosphate dependent enzyme [bacterium]